MLVRLFVGSSEPPGAAPGPGIPDTGEAPSAWALSLAPEPRQPLASPPAAALRVLSPCPGHARPIHDPGPLLTASLPDALSSLGSHLRILRGRGPSASPPAPRSALPPPWSRPPVPRLSVRSRAPPWQGQVSRVPRVPRCTELAPGPGSMRARGRRVAWPDGWQRPLPSSNPALLKSSPRQEGSPAPAPGPLTSG